MLRIIIYLSMIVFSTDLMSQTKSEFMKNLKHCNPKIIEIVDKKYNELSLQQKNEIILMDQTNANITNGKAAMAEYQKEELWIRINFPTFQFTNQPKLSDASAK